MKNKKTNNHLFEYEKKFWYKHLLVCGIDEVGRGCLAGPIVTSAAILHKNSYHPLLADSKTLTKKQLLTVYSWLIQNCTYSIGIHSPRIIDTFNIYQTTIKTMKQALHNLYATTQQQPSLILIDAMPLNLTSTPYHNTPNESLVKGESKSASIAAASIIAKVTRDKILQRTHNNFPCYNLQQHKGYGTKQHQIAIVNQHPSVIHRKTFLKRILPNEENHEQQNIF